MSDIIGGMTYYSAPLQRDVVCDGCRHADRRYILSDDPTDPTDPLVARTCSGEEFHNPHQAYSLAEDAECLAMCLDAASVPTKEGDNGLSLWGRVKRYAAMASKSL